MRVCRNERSDTRSLAALHCALLWWLSRVFAGSVFLGAVLVLASRVAIGGCGAPQVTMGASASSMTVLFKPGFSRADHPLSRITHELFDVSFVEEAVDHTRMTQTDMAEMKTLADTIQLDRTLTAIGALSLSTSAAEVQRHHALALFRYTCKDLLQERRLKLLRVLHAYIVRRHRARVALARVTVLGRASHVALPPPAPACSLAAVPRPCRSTRRVASHQALPSLRCCQCPLGTQPGAWTEPWGCLAR